MLTNDKPRTRCAGAGRALLLSIALFPALRAAGACGGNYYLRDQNQFYFLVNEELDKAVLSVPGGPELAAGLKAAGAKLPRFDMQDLSSNANATFIGPLETIIFNRAKVLRRMGFSVRADKDIPWAKLKRNWRLIRGLARSLAPTYYHELVHLRQQRVSGVQVFPENEYEAALLTDICTHTMVKNDPALLTPFVRAGAYNGYAPLKSRDAFLAMKISDYFGVCAGKSAYFNNLTATYADKLPQDGDTPAGRPAGDPARLAFIDSVNKTISARWPGLWSEAALIIGRAAAAGGNYPLALVCLLPPKVEAETYGLPAATLKAISDEALKTMAAAEAAVQAGENGNVDLAAQDLLSLEQAYQRLGRPLPEELAALRAGIRAKGRDYYSARLAVEKDPAWRAYYKDGLAALSR